MWLHGQDRGAAAEASALTRNRIHTRRVLRCRHRFRMKQILQRRPRLEQYETIINLDLKSDGDCMGLIRMGRNLLE